MNRPVTTIDRLRLRHWPAGADRRSASFAGPRPIGRSRAVRPGRRRPKRSGQAERRQRHCRDRAVRYPDRDKILQAGVGFVAPGALRTRPRLRRRPANAGSGRRLSQGGRQRQHVGHGRARRDARHRGGRRQGRSAGAQLVRACGQGRQCARGRKPRGAFRRRRVVGSGRGQSLAGESGGGQFGRGAVSARS